MPKSRPATWLEKEMMLNLIKKSGKKLDVDLDKCDYIRSSAGNLVCMFEDQPVFYVTKGCRLAMPPRPKKIKTSLRNKNLKKLAKKDAKKKAAHEKQVEKQREKMAQIVEQGKEEIDRSLFETVQDREKRMRWVKVIDEEAKKVNCGEMKFDIFPVFEDSLGSVRMRIVVQPKMDKKIGEIMPKQIPPQNWSDDMVRERIEMVTQSDAFEIRLNKDVEYNLRANVLNYIKNNQALAIDTALISLMPHAEFFKFVRHIQKNGYILKPVELQKPMILPASGMVRFYIYDVMFTVSPDGSVILMKKVASFENAVTFANAHKNDLKACMRVAEELNKNESVSCSPHLAFQLDAVARTLDAKLVFDDGIDTHEEVFKEADIRASKIIQWAQTAIDGHDAEVKKHKADETERLYGIPLYGNLLALYVLKLIRKNDGKITAKTVARDLRQKDKKINSIPESGKFGLIRAEEILDIVDELQEYGLIKTGKIGHEIVLNITDDGREFARLRYRKTRLKSLDFKDYTDADWMEFVTKNEGVRTAEEMPLLEHRAVLILYPEEVKEYLKTVSDEWKMYVDMMRDFASGHEREYWDMVHEMISGDEEDDKESKE